MVCADPLSDRLKRMFFCHNTQEHCSLYCTSSDVIQLIDGPLKSCIQTEMYRLYRKMTI